MQAASRARFDAGRFEAHRDAVIAQRAFHEAPYYTDNLMHNLHVERFYQAQVINGLIAPSGGDGPIAPSGGDGPIKTEALRGVKDTPTYFHDGRLMTLDHYCPAKFRAVGLTY